MRQRLRRPSSQVRLLRARYDGQNSAAGAWSYAATLPAAAARPPITTPSCATMASVTRTLEFVVSVADENRRASSRAAACRLRFGAAQRQCAARAFEREVVAAELERAADLTPRLLTVAGDRMRLGIFRRPLRGELAVIVASGGRRPPVGTARGLRNRPADRDARACHVDDSSRVRCVARARNSCAIAAASFLMNASTYVIRCEAVGADASSAAVFSAAAASSKRLSAMQRAREISVRRHEFRVEADRLAERGNRPLVLAESPRRQPEAVERKRFARIGRGPDCREVQRLVPRLRGVEVIAPRDEEPLALADPVAQLERLAARTPARPPIDRCWRTRRTAAPAPSRNSGRARSPAADAESLRRAEPRGLRRARASRREALRATRSSRAAAGRRTAGSTRATRRASRAGVTWRIPSAVRTCSFAGTSTCSRAMHVAGLRVDRLERDHVMAAETGDRSGNERLELLAPRDLARERARDALVGRTLHQTQRVAHAARRETPSGTATARVRPRARLSTCRRTPARRCVFMKSARTIVS